jgi:hypothetical protein
MERLRVFAGILWKAFSRILATRAGGNSHFAARRRAEQRRLPSAADASENDNSENSVHFPGGWSVGWDIVSTNRAGREKIRGMG